MRSKILFLAILNISLCCIVRAEAPADDKASLQGVWTAETMEANGKPAPAEAIKWMRFTFKGDKLLVRGNHSDAHEDECAWKSDPSKSPKQIDMIFGNNEKAALGIYELKGDTLKVCFRKAGGDERPKEFTTKPESDTVLIEFKRGKADGAAQSGATK